MLSRTAIPTVIYGLLVAVAVIAEDLRYAFIPACIAVVIFLVAGCVLFPRRQAAVQFPLPATPSDGALWQPVRLCNMEVVPQPYPQRLTCLLQLHHVPQLIACGLLALITLSVLTHGKASFASFSSGGAAIFRIEFAAIGGLIVLITAFLWMTEARILKVAAMTLGAITGRGSDLRFTRAMYEFRDAVGERRGGYAPVFGKDADNAVVVFYDPTNPDRHVTHRQLMFHRFLVRVDPGLGEGRLQGQAGGGVGPI